MPSFALMWIWKVRGEGAYGIVGSEMFRNPGTVPIMHGLEHRKLSKTQHIRQVQEGLSYDYMPGCHLRLVGVSVFITLDSLSVKLAY